MLQTSEYKYRTHSNKTDDPEERLLLSMEQKMCFYRTWFGLMVSISGLYLAVYNIAKACNSDISWLVFYAVFFICLGVIVLGGWIIFLANHGRWESFH